MLFLEEEVEQQQSLDLHDRRISVAPSVVVILELWQAESEYCLL